MTATQRVTPKRIGEIVHEAIIAAHKNYEKISHGDWLWTGAEYYLTVTIAHQLYKKLGEEYPVAVEYKIRGNEVKGHDSIIETRGRKPKVNVLPDGSRVDCLLYGKESQNYKAAAAIEVKTSVSPAGVKGDIERLVKILSHPTHKFPCIFAYWGAAGGERAKATLEKRIQTMDNIIDDLTGRKLKRSQSFGKVKVVKHEGGPSAYLAYCAIIEKA